MRICWRSLSPKVFEVRSTVHLDSSHGNLTRDTDDNQRCLEEEERIRPEGGSTESAVKEKEREKDEERGEERIRRDGRVSRSVVRPYELVYVDEPTPSTPPSLMASLQWRLGVYHTEGYLMILAGLLVNVPSVLLLRLAQQDIRYDYTGNKG